jgi:acetolactate synthase-1/2/3 large subunit
VVDALVERGVGHLFGVPGHGAYPIYGALNHEPRLKPIVGRNEQGIGFVADGWSWATNKVSVATCVPQAGLTNSATPILQATLDGERVLYVLEEEPGHRDVLRSTAKYYARVNRPEEIRTKLHSIIDQLEDGRPAGAAIEFPTSVLVNAAPNSGPKPGRVGPRMPTDAQLEEAAALLSKAANPVIVAGRPVVAGDGEQALLELAEKLRAPVHCHYNAKGAFPDNHRLALGFTWSATSAGEKLLEDADVVLAIGPREGVATGRRSPEQLASQLIHLDWDDDEQQGQPARLAIAGHVGLCLRRLADLVKPRTTDAVSDGHLAELRDHPWRYADTRIPWATGFFRSLGSELPRDIMLFCDSMVGIWAFRMLEATMGRSFRFGWGNGSGTLGYATPGAIGAKMAEPAREAVIITGDGAMLYNPQELATMMMYGTKLTVIVCNDNSFGAVRDNLGENFGGAIAHGLANPDFMALADAFGMRAVKCEDPNSIGKTLLRALDQSSSTLIEVPLELRPYRG